MAGIQIHKASFKSQTIFQQHDIFLFFLNYQQFTKYQIIWKETFSRIHWTYCSKEIVVSRPAHSLMSVSASGSLWVWEVEYDWWIGWLKTGCTG